MLSSSLGLPYQLWSHLQRGLKKRRSTSNDPRLCCIGRQYYLSDPAMKRVLWVEGLYCPSTTGVMKQGAACASALRQKAGFSDGESGGWKTP